MLRIGATNVGEDGGRHVLDHSIGRSSRIVQLVNQPEHHRFVLDQVLRMKNGDVLERAL
jgi:hypothetical protein